MRVPTESMLGCYGRVHARVYDARCEGIHTRVIHEKRACHGGGGGGDGIRTHVACVRVTGKNV